MNLDVDQTEIRELDQRTDDGIEVTLLWSARTGTVFVAVEDSRTGEAFHFSVEPAEALDGFRHPYAYSRQRSRPATLRSARGPASPRAREFG